VGGDVLDASRFFARRLFDRFFVCGGSKPPPYAHHETLYAYRLKAIIFAKQNDSVEALF
jgi:hypothetical protein